MATLVTLLLHKAVLKIKCLENTVQRQSDELTSLIGFV